MKNMNILKNQGYLLKIRQKTLDALEESRFAWKPFLILLAIYCVAATALIRANFLYIDDVGRAAWGYKEWNHFSRWTSYYLSSLLHGGSYLTDISPLPQLLAIALMALASVMVIWLFTEKKRFSAWSVIAVIPLCLSPYFLECLSYKFDAPYMSISVISCVFPFLFWKRGYGAFLAASLAGIVLMCTSYQAASGIYPMLAVFLCFRRWNQGEDWKKCLKFLLASAGNYILGLLIFRLLLMAPVAADDYVSSSILPLNQLLWGTVRHLYGYALDILEDFSPLWLVLIFLISLSYLYQSVRNSARKKGWAFLASGAALCLSLLLCFGVYPFLEKPLYNPRGMYGFGCWIAFLTVSVGGGKKALPGKLLCLALSWLFFVFTLTYGNALAEQKRYTEFRVGIVVQDLSELPQLMSDDEKIITVTGDMGYAPGVESMLEDYPMLHSLVPHTFNSKFWGEFYLVHHFGLNNIELDETIPVAAMDLPVLKETAYHTISGDEGHIRISLKDQE